MDEIKTNSVNTNDELFENNETSNNNTLDKGDFYKILGVIDLLSIFTGLGIFMSVIFYIIKKDNLTQEEKQEIYNQINFQLSYTIYIFVSALLMVILIGFFTLIAAALLYGIACIIGAIKHFNNESYDYIFSIKLLK